jgi:hypothetical protein
MASYNCNCNDNFCHINDDRVTSNTIDTRIHRRSCNNETPDNYRRDHRNNCGCNYRSRSPNRINDLRNHRPFSEYKNLPQNRINGIFEGSASGVFIDNPDK